MSSGFTALDELGIRIEDGLLKTLLNSICIQDIQRVEIQIGSRLGELLSFTHLTTMRLRLVVHGSFGVAVIAERKRFGLVWLHTKWAEKQGALLGSAKRAIEALMSQS